MYRTIDTAFWTDPKVRLLPTLGRTLLLYFITNPHTHVSGIYYLPKHVIAHETGISDRALDTLSDTLSSAGFCAFDPARELVWVKNMMRYQGKGDPGLALLILILILILILNRKRQTLRVCVWASSKTSYSRTSST